MRYLKTITLAIACIAFTALPCKADVKQSELVPSGHWVYDAMTYLSVESGETTLAQRAPESYAELRAQFGLLVGERLSTQGKNLYEKVARFLGGDAPIWSSGAATLDVKPAIALSASLPHDDDTDFTFDRVERFNDRKPLVSIPLTIGFTPAVTAFADFAFGTGFWAANGQNDFTNIPLTADSFDANAPANAYVSAGNAFLTVSVGRGALSVGRTMSGSMILSDSCDRLDYASLTLFSPKVRISVTPIELAPDRFAYFHDISFRPLPFVGITLSEAATVHSGLDPRYLNPVMIFHNYAGWRDDYGQEEDASPVGTQFGLSADLVPLRGLRLYGQLAVNQFQTSYELSKYDSASDIPNSIGGLAGIEYIKGVSGGFLVVTAEGVRTNPWLYVLTNSDISFYWSRKELVAPSGHTTDDIAGWLGTPYGRDAIAGALRVLYDVPLSRALSAEYRVTRETSDETPFAEGEGQAGVRHGITLSCKERFSESIEVEGSIGYAVMKRENWAGAPEAAVSVEWKPR
jgi:hypothetical protein